VFETARAIVHVAGDLGMHLETLGQWCARPRPDSGRRHDRLTAAKRERIAELER
jgi:hypothetical protein